MKYQIYSYVGIWLGKLVLIYVYYAYICAAFHAGNPWNSMVINRMMYVMMMLNHTLIHSISNAATSRFITLLHVENTFSFIYKNKGIYLYNYCADIFPLFALFKIKRMRARISKLLFSREMKNSNKLFLTDFDICGFLV